MTEKVVKLGVVGCGFTGRVSTHCTTLSPHIETVAVADLNEERRRSVAEEFGVPVVDINAIDLDPDIVKVVQEKLIREHYALPIYKRGTTIILVTHSAEVAEYADRLIEMKDGQILRDTSSVLPFTARSRQPVD